MTNREKIRAEVESCYEEIKYNQKRVNAGLDSSQDLIQWQLLQSAFLRILSFIDSLPSEDNYMTPEEIKTLIDEEVDKKLRQYGLIKAKKSTCNYYNPNDMHDSWYND